MIEHPLDLGAEARADAWREALRAIESYAADVSSLPVAPAVDIATLRDAVAELNLDCERTPREAISIVEGLLRRYQTHAANPRYFGLFDPAPATMSIIGDALASAFNSQLAVWPQSPFAIEAEQHLVSEIGRMFGYGHDEADGVFTSGGGEANLTAVLLALSRRPETRRHGLRALPAQPVVFVSEEGHHSIAKAVQIAGLGQDAIRTVATDSAYRMRTEALEEAVRASRTRGEWPLMIVATAGTTSSGAIDPLERIGEIASSEGAWFHVDAAWGGAVVLLPECAALLRGIELADSITFDPHKWLSIARGTGLLLTRHGAALEDAFGIDAVYMPPPPDGATVVNPFARSVQWSRRFIGLRLLMTLLVCGWNGYRLSLREQFRLGSLLRNELRGAKWRILNDTPLPLVCFAPDEEALSTPDKLAEIARRVLESGEAWISVTRIGGRAALRACITNFRTNNKDVYALATVVSKARQHITASAGV